MKTNLSIRVREGMSTLLCDNDQIIGHIKDSRYESLLLQAARLREQLDIAVFLLDELPDIDVPTETMHEVLENSKVGND